MEWSPGTVAVRPQQGVLDAKCSRFDNNLFYIAYTQTYPFLYKKRHVVYGCMVCVKGVMQFLFKSEQPKVT